MTSKNNPEHKTESFFHSYAADFNSIYGNENNAFTGVVNRLFRKSMRLRFELTMQACTPLDQLTVLDVGCGPGHYSLALAKQGAIVTGIDFAPGMISIANLKSQSREVRR